MVARLDPASRIKRRDTAKLWADTAKLTCFEPGELATESPPSREKRSRTDQLGGAPGPIAAADAAAAAAATLPGQAVRLRVPSHLHSEETRS